MKARFFALLFLPLLISSCAKERTERIANNAFADMHAIPYGFAAGSSFSIAAAPNNNPMLAKEIALKIEKLMQEQGYVITSAPNAEYHLTFTFAMTTLKTIVQTPKTVTGFTQEARRNIWGNLVNAKQSQQKIVSSQSVVFVPEEKISYKKTVQIQVYDAYEHEKNNQAVPLWQGSANKTDCYDDLRDSMNYLLVASFRHFGNNTQKTVYTLVGKNDEEVRKLRSNWYLAS